MNNRMAANLQIKTMYRFFIIFFLFSFAFFSCTKHEKQKKQVSFSQPIIIKASSPIITLLDTCSKPIILVIPPKGSRNYSIPTNDGLKTAFLSPPVINKLIPGGFSGNTFMKNLGTEQGLGLSTICCGYKDKTGNLWFGTMGGGISKYDGKSFTNYTVAQGLANNTVKCIIEDKKGNLWFATNGGGVSKYDGKSFTNFQTDRGLVSNRVFSITEDKSGNLWFSTDKGISKYDPTITKMGRCKFPVEGNTAFTNFNIDQGLASNFVGCSFTDTDGNLWFGTSKGISKFTPKPGPASPKEIKTITQVNPESFKDNTSSSSGMSGKSLFTNYTISQGLAANNVTSIAEDKNGNLWFGTYCGGVSRLSPHPYTSLGSDKKKLEEPNFSIKDIGKEKGRPSAKQALFTNFNHANGLIMDCISCIIEDRNGNLWFGSGAGVSKYDPSIIQASEAKPFTNFTTSHGLANNNVCSITEDKTGNIWFGTDGGGLSKYDGKSFTSFTTEQGIINNKVWSIAEDKKENLWFGTSDGISIYDGKSFTNFYLNFIMSSVRCVLEDKMGNIWFGSSYGATKYDGKTFTNYSMAQGLPHNTILSIAEDKKGNIWFGTYGGGVSKYDGNRVEAIEKGENIFLKDQQDLNKIKGKLVKSFKNFNTSHGLAGNNIKCILEDKAGNMWFGTSGNGVSKYDGKSFTNYSRAHGLSENTILSIMEDKTGDLWFGTAGGGVCRYNPKLAGTDSPFTAYTSADGLADDVVYGIVEDTVNHIIWFGTNLGLSGLKLNTLSLGADGAEFENFNNNTGYPIKDVNTSALFLDKKGILWAGTSDKLVRFDYKSIHKRAERPAVFIQSVKIQGENITWYDLKSQKSETGEIKEADSLAALNEEIINNKHALNEAK